MKLSTRYRLNGIFHIVRGTVRGFVGRIGAKRTLAVKGTLERSAAGSWAESAKSTS